MLLRKCDAGCFEMSSDSPFDVLTDVSPESLWAPLPSSRDHQIKALLGRSEPAELLALIKPQHWDGLCVFAERMAALAVRLDDRPTLRLGLVAAALAGLGESRDPLTLLPLFYDAALKVGADPEALFDQVSAEVGGAAAEILKSFPGRPAEDRSLSAMGYREAKDEDGFRYLRTW